MAGLSRSMAWQTTYVSGPHDGAEEVEEPVPRNRWPSDLTYWRCPHARHPRCPGRPPDVVTGTDRVFGGRHRVHLVTPVHRRVFHSLTRRWRAACKVTRRRGARHDDGESASPAGGPAPGDLLLAPGPD